MEFCIKILVFGAVIVALANGDESTCVVDEKSSLMACFNPLKDDLKKENPADINTFLCGNPQKERVDCLIKKFKMCPQFKEESFLDELKHSSTGFHSKDLFYVDSADLFCECEPTTKCLSKVDTAQMAIEQEGDIAWNKMPNTDYICGAGKPHLECVGKALPECDMYLQYKHNQTNKANYFDVTHIEHAAIYAKKHCGDDRVKYESYKCSNKRAQWHALSECAQGARLYTSDEDKSCGLRRCIDINFATCTPEEIAYFVDGINVFSEYKVNVQPCSTATTVLATLATLLMAFFLTLAL